MLNKLKYWKLLLRNWKKTFKSKIKIRMVIMMITNVYKVKIQYKLPIVGKSITMKIIYPFSKILINIVIIVEALIRSLIHLNLLKVLSTNNSNKTKLFSHKLDLFDFIYLFIQFILFFLTSNISNHYFLQKFQPSFKLKLMSSI